ncbi:hypothetical protein [Pelotomaculum propionicicum]|uniref:Glycosyl transferase family 1 domain-containing protein n=1 Tax=Pelotomaculum propionicicum TaxID=258475 RepID=A0A4Y7RV28_9FIRM|nr:hypothetical protein [Pelotomaculum propionicicum]NLI14042.1 hypothetical protein [Peptococcaceae bacterium]TEB12589.1 hypothetical protein Pmgp_00920 [Pelotomaculum propionicicum]
MKFCLVSQTPPNDLDLKDVNRITQWATVMEGAHYNGLAFDSGENGLSYEFFSEFDLVMAAVRLETIEIGLKIKKQSTAHVVVFVDGEMEHFISYLPGDKQVKFIELLNTADAVGVTHEYSIPIIKALTTRPVGLVGVPFPLKRVREELCPPVEKKQAIHVGCGTGKSFNRNGIVNLAALSEIGLPGVVDVWGPEDIEYVRLMKKYMPLPPIYFSHTPPWEDYITQLNYSIMGLHLDFRQIWGRFALDCAAVRMPCIAPDNFYTQKRLFPRLCVKSCQDIDGAVKMAKELLKNDSFYEEVMAYAESQLDYFDNEAAKKRLLDLYDRISSH